MEIITSEDQSHWYDYQANPRHFTPYADKKRKGEFRKTTLKDAKREGYFPSVTSILQIINKPGLELWKLEQCLMAALTLPRAEAETEDGFAKRVVEDMKAQTKEAARKGTALHNAAERYLQRKPLYLDDAAAELFVPVRKWLDDEVEEVILVETVQVHQGEQYAGTIDLIAILKSYGPAIVDFKTSAREDIKPYQEWSLQLESYRQAYLDTYPKASLPALLSVIIASDEPRDVLPHQWPEEGTESRINAFKAAHDLWRWSKDFPRTIPEPLEQF